MEEKIHRWEVAGVGKGPFKVVGLFSLPSPSLAEKNPDAYNNILRSMPNARCGTCAVCGMGIMHNYIIEDATGKMFSVGSECVNKAGNKHMTTRAKALKTQQQRELRQAKKEAQREQVLQAERNRNGGLTNVEMREKKADEERKAKMIALKPVIDLLAHWLIDWQMVNMDSVILWQMGYG